MRASESQMIKWMKNSHVCKYKVCINRQVIITIVCTPCGVQCSVSNELVQTPVCTYLVWFFALKGNHTKG